MKTLFRAHSLPLWSIALVLMSLPTYVIRFSIVGIPTTVLEIVLVIVVCLIAIYAWRSKAKWRLHDPLLLWGLLFMCIGLSAVFVANDTRAALGLYKAYIIEPVLFALAARFAIRTKEDILFLLYTLSIPACIIAVCALMQYVTGWGIPVPWNDFPERRSTAFYGYPNAIGLFLAPFVSVFFAITVHWKMSKKARYWFSAVNILSLIAIVAARADGALVAVCVSATVTLFFTRLRFIALGVFSGLIIFALLVPTSREVILFQDTSGQVHVTLWQGTIRLLQDHPLTGVGLSGFPEAYDHYREPSHVELLQYSHNVVFDFWSELGLSGVVWLIGTIVVLIVLVIRFQRIGEKESATMIAAIVTPFIIYGLVDVPYFKNDLSILFWFWLSCIFVLYKKSIRSL